MSERASLLAIFAISAIALVWATQTLSISAREAELFFHAHNAAATLARLSTALFGYNDLALRLPFILLHVASMGLLYAISKRIVHKPLDRVMSVGIYALLPGVNSAALLVNNSGIVIFLTLLFTYLSMREAKICAQAVLIVSLFIDNSFVMFYLALSIYALMQRKYDLLILVGVLLGAAFYLYGFDTGGKPKGYFMDTLGVYAAVFSPLLFIYFVYAMYRIGIKEEKGLLWYISFFSLFLSLLLSLRQRLMLEDFAPFVVLSVPLMVKVFLNSYRVRLPQFRLWHRFFLGLVLLTLFLNTLASYLHQPLYHLYEQPTKHFAHKHHVAKELAHALHVRGITRVIMHDVTMALRLRFYGIGSGGGHKLSATQEIDGGFEKICIAYAGIEVKCFYLYEV